MATKKVNIDLIAKDKTRQAMQSATKGVDGVKSSVLNLKNALIGLGAGIAIKGFVDVGRSVEDLQVRLKALFGSTEEGAKAFQVMADFAAKVPFSLEQIQQASGNLAVVSDDANELAKILKITGNVAAVTGLDFAQTAEQIQRSFSGGIAAADVFRERGVRDMLGFSAGATVSAEETIKAFEKVFGEGGEFGNTTNELANTFTGTLSMLSDSVFKFQKRVADAEFFAALKKEFKNLDTFIKENEATFNDIADVIGGALAGAVKLLSTTIKAIAVSVDAVTTAYEFLIETLNKLPLVNIKLITKEQRQLQRELMSYEDTIMKIVRLREEELKASIKTSLENKKTQEETKKTLDLRKHMQELIKDAENKELKKQLFIQTEINKKKMEFNKIVSEAETEFAKQKNTQEKVLEKIKEQNQEFDLSNLIFENINLGVESMSRGIAESVILGKSLKNTFSNMAKTLAVEVLTTLIKIVAQKGVELAMEKLITKEKQKQAAISKASSFASGFSFLGGFLGFADGGRPPVGRPSIVGEKGPELFVPSQSGTVVPNNQLGMSQPVTVNFNINTVDARGFNELLVNSRGVIVNMINSAVNEKGKAALI